LSPPIFALVQKAHVHIAFGELVVKNVFHLRELKFGIANHGDVFFLEFNGRSGALEVKAGGNFLGGVLDGVFHLDQVGFTDRIKRGHGGILSATIP